MTAQQLGGIDLSAIRDTLIDAAEAAARETLPRFRTALAVDNKLAGGFDPGIKANIYGGLDGDGGCNRD